MKSKICGIYCIENVLDHKKYIGQSVDIYARWSSHLSELRYNKHKNSYFQRSWNKYGKENFKFYVLEICPKSQLDNRERWNIKYYKSYERKYGYNRDMGGQSIRDITPYQRKKASEANKGKFVSNYTRSLLSDVHSKSVICLNTKHKFKSRTEAANYYHCSTVTISDIVNKKCRYIKINDEYLQFCSYEDYINNNYHFYNEIELQPYQSKHIYLFTTDGKFYKQFYSQLEFINQTNISRYILVNSIKNKQIIKYNGIDLFVVDSDEYIIKHNNGDITLNIKEDDFIYTKHKMS